MTMHNSNASMLESRSRILTWYNAPASNGFTHRYDYSTDRLGSLAPKHIDPANVCHVVSTRNLFDEYVDVANHNFSRQFRQNTTKKYAPQITKQRKIEVAVNSYLGY
jgi:hypothetical protein